MERTQSHARIREKLLHTFPHFGGGLCGEGQRQDFFRFYTAKNPILDSLGQDGSLARAGPRQNQKLRTLFMVVQHRCTLVRIQPFQDFFGVHNASYGLGRSTCKSPPLSKNRRTPQRFSPRPAPSNYFGSPVVLTGVFVAGVPPSKNTNAPNRLSNRLTK